LIVADAHLFIVYTTIWMSTTWGITLRISREQSARRFVSRARATCGLDSLVIRRHCGP
jgi:hypothetical protein